MASLAAILMLTESALFMDMAFNWRWKLHQSLMNLAMRRHEYEQRGTPQRIAVVLLASLLAVCAFAAWGRLRQRGAQFLPVFGVMLSLTVWCIEVVSLHAVDYFFYQSLFGVKAVCLLWILAGTMTSFGILRDTR